jgi:bifunctional non-homologous end joining protein LigD
MRPMLAMSAARVPAGADWVHEVKWDGMRVLADVAGGRVTLTSRTERDVTVAFPELAALADQFEDMLLDGEIVAMRAGVPSFPALAERFHVTNHRRAVTLAAQNPATLMAFDLLRLYGVDLTQRSLADRRATLERLELAGPHWQVPPTFADGEVLRDATRDQGLEGIVSKRLTSRYHPGLRSEEWLKFPHRSSISVLIGGWRPETDSTDRLGAVLVGAPGPEGLRYLGRVGSGIAGKAGVALAKELAGLALPMSPFAGVVPREDALGATFVDPVLVCEVQALGLTPQGRLRQPAYRGRRPDLVADDVTLEDVPGA